MHDKTQENHTHANTEKSFVPRLRLFRWREGQTVRERFRRMNQQRT